VPGQRNRASFYWLVNEWSLVSVEPGWGLRCALDSMIVGEYLFHNPHILGRGRVLQRPVVIREYRHGMVMKL
jgi:hypothetical protein